MTPKTPSLFQALIGAGVLLIGLGLAAGAVSIPSNAGYGGVGPNFLPWLIALSLLVCGGFIVWEARSGGFRSMDEPAGAAQAYWPGFAWVSAGLLANAALITTLGFILSCTLCFVLASRGMRNAQGQAGNGAKSWVNDTITGLLIATPVYWMFTQALAINLPGLTNTGWL